MYYKFGINCRSIIIKIIWSEFWVFPLQHPQISRDFDSFSNFLEKLEISFWSIFWYYVQHELVHFFQFFPGGVTINFSLETPPKRPKIFNFLNIHLIRNWEYEPYCKIKWLRRFRQKFSSFDHFLIQKIITPNIVT